MLHRILLLPALLCLFSLTFANDYEEAWKALHKNDRKTAKVLLEKAMQESSTSVDAYLTYVYLQTFEGRETSEKDFFSKVYKKVPDANPYIYAMWFNDAVLGNYGKKKPHQWELLEKMMGDGNINGSMKSAAHYVKAMHYLFGNDYSGATKEWKQMGSVGPLWQLAGPFDNLSGSGYYKNYGPLEHPEAGANFTSLSNASISWFSPPVMTIEGWTFPHSHILYNTAIVYAQTFVQAPADMKVLLNAGVNGSLKVWVNDQPVLAESKEIVTELDYYKNYVQLKKGYNRVLVQLGYMDNSSPNFIIRFTDEQYNTIPGLTYTPAYQAYPKAAKVTEEPHSLPHFAEVFFEKKVKAEPNNVVNYILLSQTYLRNKKTSAARKLLTEALERFKDNSLLRFQFIQCLLKEGNRTLLSLEVERMKETDPNCVFTYNLNLQQLKEDEKYEEAMKELDKMAALSGEDEDILVSRIQLYGSQNKMDELVKTLQDAYNKYPNNVDLVSMMFRLKKNGYKDAKGALKVYESYLKQNYNYQVIKALAQEYNEQGMSDKALQLFEGLKDKFSYDPDQYMTIANFYYDKQQYNKAEEYTRKALVQAPYVASYWQSLGLELQQQHKDNEAMENYRKALYYDANKYTAREQLRELQKKPMVWKAFPETDVYELIKQSASKTYDHNSYYLLDEKSIVVYPEGATEEYMTMVVKIINEKGIDDWKEVNLSYNSNSQYLLVEKAEAVKKNGNKIKAEQSGNQLVFTGLEAGDALYIKYKIQHYSQGRLAKEFWDRYTFNAYVPVETARYSLLVAKNIPLHHTMLNATVKPAVSTYDDFTLYTWEMKDPAVAKPEKFMPPLNDVGPSLYLSSLSSWADIAAWYSDLSSSKTEDDFEVKQVYQELFPNGKGTMSEAERAKIIYTYITSNIRYSSVSFRQSAYVPQKAATTINTRLGDCKDLSSLFVGLAKMAGIKANLVLVNTRDNGLHAMEMPSVEFNHCIVKTTLDGKEYFLELTDNDLPFASLPSNLYKAAYLVIPEKSSDTAGAQLKYLYTTNRVKDKVRRNINVTIEGSDIKMAIKAVKTGNLTSGLRANFGKLTNEKQKEEMEKSVSSWYKNPVKLTSISFTGLESLTDSVSFECKYKVTNEVTEVGDMGMIKIPFGEIVASIDNLTEDERKFPIEYWSYEDTDEYETSITVQAPAGKTFVEIPKNENCTFNGSTYSLQFVKKSPTQLEIIRKAKIQRDNVAPADYAALKVFFNKIIKAESKYIAFK
ncbi:DUF3857 domain-containing protein [Paraflavitalea soli]|uniref:DUF3857 domain-containing protein n=1 Tax=Paraflavitalea soli TaxID=2315862 RepID=A0A3B7MU16_9BACT|nr:DUF3857 domain-containing protein [Paraflavitalea soli]AXY77357.1 DUF3857 domain-containing protein [Paraflavitalea soli]